MYATLHNAGTNYPETQQVTVHQSKEEALQAADDAVDREELNLGDPVGSLVFDLLTPQEGTHGPEDITHAVLINRDVEHLDTPEQQSLGPWTELIGYGSREAVDDSHPQVDNPEVDSAPYSIQRGVLFIVQ